MTNTPTMIPLDPGPFAVPMPLVLVGARVDGKPNFMPAAFVGVVNFQPPTLVCGLSPRHHTVAGLEAAGRFSVNLPPPELVVSADWCGLHSGEDVDKAGLFELLPEADPSSPIIRGCRLAAECRLTQKVELPVDTVFFGEIVKVWADPAAAPGGKPDWKKIDPLLFTFPDKSYWRLGDWVARAWSVGKQHKPG
jgi:flavin reductase (DIM6/NTAB) family NADH-FMN oxidoreductase RutF